MHRMAGNIDVFGIFLFELSGRKIKESLPTKVTILAMGEQAVHNL
jgi:hypothetical protein